MPAPPLESLAVELLHKIYEHACTDGGLTGCSLSLVSKRVRAASRPARFHSVALMDGTTSQVARFLSCYTKERAAAAGSVCPVRHMCIAIVKKGAFLSSRSPRTRSLARQQEDRQRIVQEREVYHADVLHLFRLVAPHVHTLSFVQEGTYSGLPSIESVEWASMLDELNNAVLLPGLRDIDVAGGFPELKELAIIGHHPLAGPSLLYPRLTKLSIEYYHLGCGPCYSVQWATRAPRLTYLRLSDVTCVTEQLRQIVDDEKPVFRKLLKLFIQPTPPPGGWCGNAYDDYARDMGELAQFQLAPRRLPVELLPYKERDTTWAQAVGQEWQDAVLGRQGAWPETMLSEAMTETLEYFLELDLLGEEPVLPAWTQVGGPDT